MHTKTDLLKGNILKSLILFAIPLIISNLFQQLYNAADTMIVGHFLGDESLAAIGACAAVYELLVGFALGFGNGLSMVVARSFGVGDKDLLKPCSCRLFGNWSSGDGWCNADCTDWTSSASGLVTYTIRNHRGILFLYLYCNNLCWSNVCI